jgi:transposase
VTGRYLTSFQRKFLQKNLEKPESELPQQLRKRLQIMLYADEGKSQTEICQLLKCSSATARTWILKAKSGMAHQWEDHPVGRPKIIQEEHLARLLELINLNPRDLGERFDEWTGYSLSRRLEKEFGIKVSNQHINRLLRQSHSFDPSSRFLEEMPDSEAKVRISIQDLPRDRSL